MDILQDKRGAKILTVLGPDALVLRSLSFDETLNADFEGHVEVLSTNFNIDPREMIGQFVTIELETMLGPRYFNAVASKFQYAGAIGRHALYEIRLTPWMQLLTLRQDCRVFTNMTAPKIIEEVLEKANCKGLYDIKSLSDEYRERELCIQYNETDENFIRRLMAQEGINSFYRHTNGNHELVLTDMNDEFENFPGYESLKYFPKEEQRRAEGEHVYAWTLNNLVSSGTHATSDYDFKMPGKDLYVSSTAPDKHKNDDQEIFQWPGNFVKRTDGERYTKISREQAQNLRGFANGQSNARGLSAGHVFSLENFPKVDVNGAYLVVSVHHSFKASDFETVTGAGGGSALYENTFTCSDPKMLYRGHTHTKTPIIHGPQTATIVGDKEGKEEIWTDEYGRVQIRFHWDRHWDEDASNSEKVNSAWLRVAQKWAGPGWGSQHIPRVGQEVIVEFLDGNPDYPIVTGAVYNGDNKPPFSLPENKTQSGIRSQSTKDGTGFNQFLFEDKKGGEYIHTVAEKDMVTDVKNDKFVNIGNNYVRTIHANEVTEVTGKRQVVVKDSDMSEITKDRWAHVKNNDFLKVIGTITSHAEGDILIQGDNSITLKCGEATIQLTKDGRISLNGAQVDSTASGANILKGAKITLN